MISLCLFILPYVIAETSEPISTEFSAEESTLQLSGNMFLAHVRALTCGYVFDKPRRCFGFSYSMLKFKCQILVPKG
jgi:hypothetical protein